MRSLAYAEPSPPPAQAAGRTDPRLVAWRSLVTYGCVRVLRGYHESWTQPELDDAGRAAAAIGVVDAWPPVALPALATDGELARIVAHVGLAPADEAVLAATWWSAVDPQVAALFGCVHDDAARRHASLGLVGQALAGTGLDVPVTLSEHHRLASSGLIGTVDDAATPLHLPGTTVALLAGDRPAPPPAELLPARLARVVEETCALVTAGRRVLVRCAVDDDREVLLAAVAAAAEMAIPPNARPAAVADLLHGLGHELPAVVLDDDSAPPAGTVVAFGGATNAAPPRWHTVDVAAPTRDAAVRAWRTALRRAGLRPPAGALSELAGRLPLAERSIDDVVIAARSAAGATGRATDLDDVRAALRAHPRHDPGGLARRLPTTVTLDDLVLPGPTRAALDDFVAHARWSAEATDRLGLTGVRGRAVIALFHGPSGTGKTAAAEAAATALDRELWVVDLAKVVSKWLGESQRHIDGLLTHAATAGALLLFDEADGLFGKRGEVTDARDRYANLEIDHLLQRVELHEGVVVLTSNRPGAIDDAFARRIRLSVRFQLPGHDERKEIWRRYLPDDLLAKGSTRRDVAREELTGAAIRAAALAATVRALEDGTRVSDQHLASAVQLELEKTRRPPTSRGPR